MIKEKSDFMEVRFREVDPFNCWIWFHFADVPSDGEKSYIDGILDSWYVIGKLGGFNSQNLQVHDEGSELSWMSYDNEEAANALPSLMHNLGQVEYQGNWARCWVDFGTSDPIALDVLINALRQIDSAVVHLESLCIGGINDDWSVEDHPDSIFSLNSDQISD